MCGFVAIALHSRTPCHSNPACDAVFHLTSSKAKIKLRCGHGFAPDGPGCLTWAAVAQCSPDKTECLALWLKDETLVAPQIKPTTERNSPLRSHCLHTRRPWFQPSSPEPSFLGFRLL